MRKCKHCGFLTRTRRKLRRHMVVCKHGQSETRPAEGRETEEELAEAQTGSDEVEVQEDEGIDYGEMSIHELRRLARAEDVKGIWSMKKDELIAVLKEGE